MIESAFNFSDHLPICLFLKYTSVKNIVPLTEQGSSNVAQTYCFRWDHGDKASYYEMSRILLLPVEHIIDTISEADLDVHDLRNEIDIIYRSIVNVLHECALANIPKIKTNALKYWWDTEMDELKLASVNSFRAWQSAGKPRSGFIHEEMIGHRLRYRKALRDKESKLSLEVSNSLNDLLLKKNFNNFWKSWKHKFGNKNNNADICIDGMLDSTAIAAQFANFFESVCSVEQSKSSIEAKNKFALLFDEYRSVSNSKSNL